MFTCMLFTTQIFFISKHLSSMFLFLFGRLVLVYFVMLLWPFLSLLFILCILLSFITRATLFWKDYTFLSYMGDLSCSIFLTFQLRVWSSFVWYPCIHLPVKVFFFILRTNNQQNPLQSILVQNGDRKFSARFLWMEH